MTQSKIFIGNLPFETKEDSLRSHFSSFGSIDSITIPVDKDTGRSRGFAFIKFDSPADAQSALATNGTDFEGRKITVNMAQEKSRDSGSNNSRGNRKRAAGGGNY